MRRSEPAKTKDQATRLGKAQTGLDSLAQSLYTMATFHPVLSKCFLLLLLRSISAKLASSWIYSEDQIVAGHRGTVIGEGARVFGKLGLIPHVVSKQVAQRR